MEPQLRLSCNYSSNYFVLLKICTHLKTITKAYFLTRKYQTRTNIQMSNYSQIICLSVSDISDRASPKPIFFSAINQSPLLYIRLNCKGFLWGYFLNLFICYLYQIRNVSCKKGNERLHNRLAAKDQIYMAQICLQSNFYVQ